MSFDWKATIKTVAPGIATALGGPLAGLAVSAIGNALGVSEPTQEKIQAAIAGAMPEDMLKLKTAEEQFQVQMKQLDIDLEKISGDDRASARSREIAVKDRTPAHLAYIVIAGFFAMSGALIYYIVAQPDQIAKIPQSGWLLIGSVYGYLAAEAKSAANYYFGSSSGSKEKDATLATIAKG